MRCSVLRQFTRTAFRIREQYNGQKDFGFIAYQKSELLGAIHFTPIKVEHANRAYLLGPLVVKPTYSGRGIGSDLIHRGIDYLEGTETRLVLLIGDLSYYSRNGFVTVPHGQIRFPGPINTKRILAKELEVGCLGDYSGLVQAIF